MKIGNKEKQVVITTVFDENGSTKIYFIIDGVPMSASRLAETPDRLEEIFAGIIKDLRILEKKNS